MPCTVEKADVLAGHASADARRSRARPVRAATARSGRRERSDVETFCALRLFIDSWRWYGVPWYLRSGKCLPVTAAEVLVQLKAPPQQLFADSAPADKRANYLRFQLSPNSAVALAARVKRFGAEFVGDQRELYLSDEQPAGETPYERLLRDAIAGDGALFTREDAVEAAWAAVDPVLVKPHRSIRMRAARGDRRKPDALIAPDGRWYSPPLPLPRRAGPAAAPRTRERHEEVE